MGKSIMKKYKHYIVILILLLSTFFAILQTATAEKSDVVLEFFYTNGCHGCDQTKPIINETENDFKGRITVTRILVIKDKTIENYSYFHDYYGFKYVPAVVIYNQTNRTNYVKFNYSQINKKDIEDTLLLFGAEPKKTTILVEYYYNGTCGTCIDILENVIRKAEQSYVGNNSVQFFEKDIENPDVHQEYLNYLERYGQLQGYPFVIVKNETSETPIPEDDLTVNNINNTINAYYAGTKPISFSKKPESSIDIIYIIPFVIIAIIILIVAVTLSLKNRKK